MNYTKERNKKISEKLKGRKNPKHSEIMKELWKKGKYNNRNEKYRKTEEYKNKVSNTVKKRWKEGVYTEERNKKISIAHKGKPKLWLRGKKDYKHKCKICGNIFITKTQHRYICDKISCQKQKASLRIINPKIEKQRRKKISKKLKGKIPKNIFYAPFKISKAELKLKEYLEKNKIKFIHQYPYPLGVADFYLPDKNLIIECYGTYWHSRSDYIKRDKKQQKWLEKNRYKILILCSEDITKKDYSFEKIKENGDII